MRNLLKKVKNKEKKKGLLRLHMLYLYLAYKNNIYSKNLAKKTKLLSKDYE